jgi:hypothetical protein
MVNSTQATRASGTSASHLTPSFVPTSTFTFQILDAEGQLVENSQFTTDSTGRCICPAEPRIGQQYNLQKLSSPVANVQLTNTPSP